MIWLALTCSAAVIVLLVLVLLDMRRRLELVARAEHELRGPIEALVLAAEHVRRGGTGPEVAGLIEAQLDRSCAGLLDISRARRWRRRSAALGDRSSVSLDGFVRHSAAGWRAVATATGRKVHLDWRAGEVEVEADRGRLAQALGNLLSNAIEHGEGEIAVSGRRVDQRVRIEVANGASAEAQASARRPGRGPDRGRGLRIAESAVAAVGGELRVAADRGGTTAVVELPVREP